MTYDRGMKMHSIWPDGTDGDKFTGACKDQKLGSLSQQSVSGMNNFCFESESYKNWFQEKNKKQWVIKVTAVHFTPVVLKDT